MIYEVAIVHLALRGVPEYIELFSEIVEPRQAISRLVGFFNCDIGELNRIMQIWEYEDAAHRDTTLAELAKQPWWPPDARHLIQKKISRLMRTAHFLPRPRTENLGNVHEVRTYVGQPGKLEDVIQHWTDLLPGREKLSPCAAFFHDAPRPNGEWGYMHFWPYRDLNHRAETRANSSKANWPPGTIPYARTVVESQVSEIWIPASFSPMH